MKKKTLLLYLFLFFFTPNFFAVSASAAAITVEAEWLYFRPSIDTHLIGATTTSGTLTQYKFLQIVPSYHSGWRVGAGYEFCGGENRLAVRWSQLNAKDRQTFSGLIFTQEFSETLPAKDTLILITMHLRRSTFTA